MKRLIKIFSVLAVLIVAVAVAGVAVLSSLDFNEYKGLIAEEAKKATGRDLKISGDLKLDISLSPSLYVEGVSFANAPWGSRPDMVKLKRLEAEVALIPLLSQEIDVKRLVLIGLDVVAETDKNGRGNWEFGDATAAAPAEKPADKGGVLPIVRKIRIKDLKVTYLDGMTGAKNQIALSALDLSAASTSAPLAFSMAGVINGQAFSGEGTAASIKQLIAGNEIPVDLKFDVLDVNATVKGAIGNLKALSGISVTATASGESLAATLAKAAKIVPEIAKQPIPDLGAFNVAATITGSAAKPGLSNFDAKLKALDVNILAKGSISDLKALSGITMTVNASGDSIEGTMAKAAKVVPQLAQQKIPALGPFDIAMTVTGSADKPGLANLTAKVGRAETTEVLASGNISDLLKPSGLNLQVVAKIKDPTGLAKEAGVDIPPLPSIFASTRVSDADGGYTLSNIDLALGGSDLKGKAQINLTGQRPKLSADLVSAVMNLDELLPKSDAAQPAPAKTAGDGRVFPADPLPLDALKAADADVKYRAGKVTVNKVDITDLNVALLLSNGDLSIKPLEATVSDGKISGVVSLGGGQSVPPLMIDLTIDKLDYGKLLASLGQDKTATGKADVKVQVTGAGSNVRAIMAGLSGKLRVVSEKGRIESNALNIASADILSALPLVDSKGDKDLRCAVIDFDITKGLVKSKAIVVETGGLSVVGVGGINLRDETLNLVFEPRAKKTSLLSAALVPVAVKGTLAKPDPQINPADIAAGAAGTVLSGAAAIMTMGASSVLQSAFKRSQNTDETDYCTLALAGKAVTPSKGEAKKPSGSGSTTGTAPPPQTETKPSNPIDSITKGIGGGLKGLFGK